jgi:hypothetical protein
VTSVVDLFLILLLMLSIGYGIMLNRRIVALRKDQKDLEKVAISFGKATQRAETGVAQLKAAAQGSATLLQESIAKAETLKKDLEYLVERAGGSADRLERSMRRDERAALPEPRTAAAPTGSNGRPVLKNSVEGLFGGGRVPVESEKVDAERQLLKALRAVR